MLGLFSPLFQYRTPAHGMVPPIVRWGAGGGDGSSHLRKPCRESNAQMCQLACLPGDSRRLPSEQSLLTFIVSFRLLRGRVQSQEKHKQVYFRVFLKTRQQVSICSLFFLWSPGGDRLMLGPALPILSR